MTKLLVELQDENGNIYYLHTDGRVVFCSDGESVENKLNKKVNTADIINNCTSTATNKPLAAAQGKTLWERITSVITSLTNHQSSADHDGRYYTEEEINTKLNTKITASGGDAADAKVSGFTANNTSFPVPTAGQTFRAMWGIMAKFCNDVKSSCFLISNIVNNCTSTATNKALSAAQGKALWDKYTQLNSDKLNIAKVYKQLWYGDGWTSGTLTVPDFSQYNLFLIGFSHVPIPMIGFKFLNTLYAYGVDLNAQYGQRIYCAQCNYSGNVLSNLKTSNVLYYYGGDVGNKETFPITHVFGIV